jgi:hypothetical protein
MPTRTNSTMIKPATGSTNKRFELPALDFKFGSLTEGTDIPPPPPSPKLEASTIAPPKTPKHAADKTNGGNGTQAESTSPGGTKRPSKDNPTSPTLSTRQGSIRRLFSKGMLNSAYQDGETSPESARPESRLSTATETKKSKRSSGWFGRLRSSENVSHNKRMSTIQQGPAVPEKKKPSGPPPPMIPELETKFGSQEDGLSADLFKDIK